MRVAMTWAAVATIATPAIAMLATPATAQAPAAARPAEPSVEYYVCKFSGKCGGVASTATMDAGATKGFRLAKAVPDKPAAIAPHAGGYVSPRAVAHGVAPVGYGHRVPARMPVPVLATLPVGSPITAPTPTLLTGAARPRADLMIGFDRNSARISAGGMQSARVFAQSLLTPDLAGKRFLIEGHTDLQGGRRINMALSERRAQAVSAFLVAQGVDRARLQAHGVGPDVPLPGHTPSDPGNRRVEAELVP